MWKVRRVVYLCHYGFHYSDFHGAITQWIIVDMSYINYIWITCKIWKYRQSFIYPSLHQFLLNSELFKDIKCWASLSDFSQIKQILKVHIEMNLHYEIKYECHWANFHKPYTCLKSLYRVFNFKVDRILIHCRPDGLLIKYPQFPDLLNPLNVQPHNIFLPTVWHCRLRSWAPDYGNCVQIV
jgi:hypothetical protein